MHLISDHDVPFAAEAIPFEVGLALIAVVIALALIGCFWPRGRQDAPSFRTPSVVQDPMTRVGHTPEGLFTPVSDPDRVWRRQHD